MKKNLIIIICVAVILLAYVLLTCFYEKADKGSEINNKTLNELQL